VTPRAIGAVLLSVLLLASCKPGTTEVAPQPGVIPADLPQWVKSVYPEPGAQMSSVSAVEVEFDSPHPRRQVRLIVDGVDVTASADTDIGRFHYDPGQSGLITLESGEHTARVELVTLSDYGDQHTLIDQYEWAFTIL